MTLAHYALMALLLIAGSCQKDFHDPDQFFSRDQQRKIIRQSVLYSTKLPPNATHETKYDSIFNWYYDIATAEYDIRACKPIGDGKYYYLMTRKARSIWPAREAIGGTFKVDQQDSLLDYNEEFRTWKMAEDSLNVRAFELFDLMVAGNDLAPYRTKYKGDRYIEFPDDRWYFNKKDKRWRDRFMDTTRIN